MYTHATLFPSSYVPLQMTPTGVDLVGLAQKMDAPHVPPGLPPTLAA